MEHQDLYMRMLELSSQGFACSQILFLLALEEEGKENPELIRAMGGLNEGLVGNGKVCGALTGGCCLLGYYGSKGTANEREKVYFGEMVGELVTWFDEHISASYGGCNCEDILEGSLANRSSRCPDIVQGVYGVVMELLQSKGCL